MITCGLWILVAITGVLAQGSQRRCLDLVGKTGFCTTINNCPSVLNILKKTNPADNEKSILKKLHCRGTNPPEFCCLHQINKEIQFTTNKTKFQPTDDKDQCGRLTRAPFKVTGGKKIRRNSHPWLAAIGIKFSDISFKVMCGGSLISNRHVLTAAHCLPEDLRNAESRFVRLGEYDLAETDSQYQDFKINHYILGPFDRKSKALDGDIALILLDREVTFSGSIQPICLPSTTFKTDILVGKQLKVVGWGVTNFELEPNIPHEAKVPLLADSVCQTYFTNGLRDTQICAGQGNLDSCKGDSGGPLIYESSEDYKHYVIGIVSYGSRQCGSNTSGVYTEVTAWLPWIHQKLKELN